MPEIEIEAGSHTESSTQPEVQSGEIDVREAFGLPPQQEQTDEEHDDEGRSVNDPPAIEDEKPEPKKITVKYNKEEIEVPEDQIPDLVEKGMNLDKVRNQKNEYEKALDRVAKQQGFKDHAELIANLDRIEQEKQQQAQDQFEQAKQSIIEQLVYNGVDEQAAREYAENNPLVKQAKAAMEERELAQQEQQKATVAQEWTAKWQELYSAFPELVESAKSFSNGEVPEWYTADMQAMVNQGYKPIDAYKLAHMDKIQTQSKKATEQKVIKQQMLGQRAQVEVQTPGGNEPTVDPALKSAFSAFGLDPKRANKYAKK